MLEERNININDNARKILRKDKSKESLSKFNESIR